MMKMLYWSLVGCTVFLGSLLRAGAGKVVWAIFGAAVMLVVCITLFVLAPLLWLLTGGSLDITEGHPWMNRHD